MLLYQSVKTIERHFYSINEIKRAVALRHEEILKSSSAGGEHIGTPCNTTGDPTGRKIEQMYDLPNVETAAGTFDKPMKWIAVFEATQRHFNGLEGDLLIKRYIEKKNVTQICDEIYIAKTTYHYWRENILNYATMLAIQYGLVRVL